MWPRNMKYNLKLFFFAGFALVLYNEFLVYWLNYLNWPELHKQELFTGKNLNDSTRPIRLLLVADPQLIGENDEPWYLSWVARWDSDRYLRSTFVLANSYTKPDATLFLGDLFDEGLKSDDEQFDRYFKRFSSIFKCEQMEKKFGIRQIFIPGDNDIGGEYVGDRNDQLAARFEKYFGSTIDLIEFGSFLEFIKLDLDYTVSFYDKVKRSYVLNLLAENARKARANRDKYTVILNHMTLLRRHSHELNALNEDTNAGLIIKGDSHKFDIMKYSYLSDQIVEYISFKNNPSNYYILNLQANKANHRIQTIYELSVPTCSYRMGVPQMGYGLLTITPHGKAYVSILWLPSRYTCLYYYLVFIFITSSYITFKLAFRGCYKIVIRAMLIVQKTK